MKSFSRSAGSGVSSVSGPVVALLYLPVKHPERLQPVHGHGLVRAQSVRLPLVFLGAVHVPGL